MTYPNRVSPSQFLSKQIHRFFGKDISSALFYYAFGSLACQALRFASVVIATSLLPPEDFGLLGKAVMCIALSGVLTDLGLSNGLIAYAGSDRRFGAFHFQATIIAAITAACAASTILSSGLVFEELRGSLFAIIGLIFVESTAITGIILAQKSLRFGYLATIDVIGSIASLILTVVLLAHSPSFKTLLYIRLTESAFKWSAVFFIETRKCAFLSWGHDVSEYFLKKFVAHGFVQSSTQIIQGQSEILILSAFASNSQIGIYDRIQQFVRVPLSASINLVDRVALVSYSKKQSDLPALWDLLKRFTIMTATLSIAAVASLSLLLPLTLPAIIGEVWTAQLMPLWWLSVPLMVIRPIVWGNNIFFQGIGMASTLTKSVTILCFCTIAFGLLFTPAYHAMGMIVTVTLAHLILLITQSYSIRKLAPKK